MLKKIRLLPLLAAAVVMSGCFTMAPKYERPETPVPEQWPAPISEPARVGQDEAISALRWREFVESPKLEQLIELALSNNRDLRVAALNVDRARALYRIQRADQLPSVDAGVQYRR